MRKKLLLFFTVAASLLFGQTADEIKKLPQIMILQRYSRSVNNFTHNIWQTKNMH